MNDPSTPSAGAERRSAIALPDARPANASPYALPILYTDASVHGLFYLVDSKRAWAALGDAPFEPWTTAGRATVLLCSFEYRESSIGAYGEIGVGVLVKRRGTKPSMIRYLRDMRSQPDVGIFIVSLPVTTSKAFVAGREVWGYPKYVAPIETDFRGSTAAIRLRGEISIDGAPTTSISTAGFPFVLLSANRGRILRTVVEVDHRVRWGGARRSRVQVIGDGPTAEAVRTLGLDRSKAVAAFRTDRMKSVLPAGVDLGPSLEW